MEERNKKIIFASAIILIFLIFFLVYLIKETSYPLSGEVFIENISFNTEDQLTNNQYLEKLHWTHMPITYKIVNKKECGKYEERMIWRGFNEIQDATGGVVAFEEVNDSADIDVSCSFIEDCYEHHIDIEDVSEYYYWKTKYETICAYDKGYSQITEYEGNKILKAEIEIIGLAGFAETDNKGMSGFSIGDCGYPDTEIHEILHTFGYEHSDNPYSIMYPSSESVGYKIRYNDECEYSIKSIDKEIIDDLIKTYS